MVPKDTGTAGMRCVKGLAPQRIYASPNQRRRQGPVTRQPSASEEIRLECMKGNGAGVEALIESGRVNANCILEGGWTPLMVAASAARPLVLEYLLTQGADPNFARPDNFTALMAASGSSQPRNEDVLACVLALLKAGAMVGAQDSSGTTPLGFAVKENRLPVVKCLITEGADVNVLDRTGRSCLFYAAERGHGQIARLLLERGADIHVIDKNGWMACEVAVEKGHVKLGELLFRVRESSWIPGDSPTLMQQFKDVPQPTLAKPDADCGDGMVNMLCNIQTQVQCLSNLVNSVRLRMVQDAVTKRYEVEPGKMEEVVIFARSMWKSCAILSNQVGSLNILTEEESTECWEESDSCSTFTRRAMSLGYGRLLTDKERGGRKSRSRCSTGWDLLLAGAAGMVLLCFLSPHIRAGGGGRLATAMQTWQL